MAMVAKVKDPFEARYAKLVARRVPLAAIELGHAYVIHARNGGVGVACRDWDGEDRLGYTLHREKWGDHFLFTETDWDERPIPWWFNGEMRGTVIPLFVIDGKPPKGTKHLLAWLTERETEHRAAIDEAWATILGPARNAGGRAR
jgi:hypothetical protein